MLLSAGDALTSGVWSNRRREVSVQEIMRNKKRLRAAFRNILSAKCNDERSNNRLQWTDTLKVG